MMGKSHPGGFHDGFWRLAYQLGSPCTWLGLRAWLLAAESPPSTMAPTRLDPKTTTSEASRMRRGSPKTATGTRSAYATEATRSPRRMADSTTAWTPILAKRAGFESLQAPPRRTPMATAAAVAAAIGSGFERALWTKATGVVVVVAVVVVVVGCRTVATGIGNAPPASRSARAPGAPSEAARQPRNWIETFIVFPGSVPFKNQSSATILSKMMQTNRNKWRCEAKL
mmetsp:Transcript_612/g.1255  ORF Transcript_612/g.1255 Transcript_612/m.1255 type:complete len:227 (+) Transcript_612:705-1385(+)